MEAQSPRDVLAAVRRMEDELDAARRATRERERQLEDVRAGVAAEQAVEHRQVVEDLERVVELIGAAWRDTRTRMTALADEVARLSRLSGEVAALRRAAEGRADEGLAADIADLRASSRVGAEELRRLADAVGALRRQGADRQELRRVAGEVAELRRVAPGAEDLRRLQDEIAAVRRAVEDVGGLRAVAADLPLLRTVASDVTVLRHRAADAAEVRRLAADVEDLRGRSEAAGRTADVAAELAELRRAIGDLAALRAMPGEVAEARAVADEALAAVRGARVELHLGPNAGTLDHAADRTAPAAPRDEPAPGARVVVETTPTREGSLASGVGPPLAPGPSSATRSASAREGSRAAPASGAEAAETAARGEHAPATAGTNGNGNGTNGGHAGAGGGTADEPARAERRAEEPVVLYDSPGCWKCDDVKEALTRLGVPYHAVTVRGDPAVRAALVAAMGEPPQVPMLVDGRRAVWDRRRILAYLDETYGDVAAPEGGGYAELPSFMGGTCRLGEGGCAA